MPNIRISMLHSTEEKGFDQSVLSGYMEQILDGDSALENYPLDVMDSAIYGDEVESLVFDSIITEYNQLPRKMKQLKNALNRFMGRNDSKITVGEPQIGKPRKAGYLASITVRFPFSDGQTIGVTFHSPDNDPMKIVADDTLIAFRWFLNSRDVTAWMSPEEDENKLVDISLSTLGKRVSQLIEANTEKFTKRQETLKADRLELEGEEKAAIKMSEAIADIEDQIPSIELDIESEKKNESIVDRRIADARALSESLKSKIDMLGSRISGSDSLEKEAAVNDKEPESVGLKVRNLWESEGRSVMRSYALTLDLGDGPKEFVGIQPEVATEDEKPNIHLTHIYKGENKNGSVLNLMDLYVLNANDELTSTLKGMKANVPNIEAWKEVGYELPFDENEGKMGFKEKLDKVGLSVKEFLVLYMYSVSSALSMRAYDAKQMGIDWESLSEVEKKLQSEKKYVNKNRINRRGEEVIRGLFNGYQYQFKDQVAAFAKGQDFAISAEIAEPEELTGTGVDKKVLAKWLEAHPKDSAVRGWNELRESVFQQIMTIYRIDHGIETDYTRSAFVQSIVNKIKTQHKNGNFDAVDKALDLINGYNAMAEKPAITNANKVWKLRTRVPSIYDKKYGEEYFDWSKEATETLSIADYRDRIDMVRHIGSDLSGHTRDEYLKANVRERYKHWANQLIAATSTGMNKNDVRNANDALESAVDTIKRWEEQGGPLVSAKESLERAASFAAGEQLAVLENTLSIAEEHAEVGELWDKIMTRFAEGA